MSKNVKLIDKNDQNLKVKNLNKEFYSCKSFWNRALIFYLIQARYSCPSQSRQFKK